MLQIYLARHGQDQDNLNGILNGHRDETLTELGLQQAKSSGQKIHNKNLKFDFVYSSPLQRAFKTAEIISQESQNPKPKILNELIERDFGIMTGKTYADIEPICGNKTLHAHGINYFLDPKGAETFPDLIQRAKTLLKKLEENHPNNTILLVAHGDIGKMIYAAYYNLDWKETIQQFYFGNADLLLLSPESSPENAHVFHTGFHDSTPNT